MPGLISRETLDLTAAQICVLAVNAGIWLSQMPRVQAAIITSAANLAAFWGEMLTFDIRLTWSALNHFDGRIIPLSEIGFLNHLKFQPPAWNWYVSAFPSYPAQQLCAAAISLLSLFLMFDLYGQKARYIAATPLFQVCMTQPVTQLYALGAILAARHLWSSRHHAAALCAAFAASMFTYTAYAVYPALMFEFGLAGSLFLIGASAAYWKLFASADAHAYCIQRDFLTRMFSFTFDRIGDGGTAAAALRRNAGRLPRNLRTGAAAIWYLFPAWMTCRSAVVGATAAAIILGGGNVKYLLLLLGIL